MAVHWVNTIVIDRPIDELWAGFLDLFNAPRLPGSSFAVRQTSPGPLGLGATIRARRVILGFETTLIQRIVQWDPPHAMAASIEGRPFRSMIDHWTLEPVAEGTKLTETLDAELVPVLRLLWPLIGPFQGRQRAQQLRDLKVKLEAEGRAAAIAT